MKIFQKDGKWFVKGKVKIGDTEHEVEHEVAAQDNSVHLMTADQLREGFVPKKSLARRIENAKTAARTELLQDEEFKTEALTVWKVGTGDGDDKNKPDTTVLIASERKKWEETALKPVQTQLSEAQKKIDSLQKTTLHSEILSTATRYGIAEDLLKPVGPSKQPMIINMIAPFFDRDEKTERWFVRDGEDFMYSSNPKEGDVYVGVDEFLNDWAKNNPALAPGYTQKGPNAGNPNNPGPVDKKAEIARLEGEGKFTEANNLKAELLQAGA